MKYTFDFLGLTFPSCHGERLEEKNNLKREHERDPEKQIEWDRELLRRGVQISHTHTPPHTHSHTLTLTHTHTHTHTHTYATKQMGDPPNLHEAL